MAIHRGWGRRSTRVINCNSTFFCHSLERGVIFPMHILSSTVQFICGVVFMQFFTSVLLPTPSDGLCLRFIYFRTGAKNESESETSLYFKMHFFRVSLLCFYIFGKHTRMCSNIANIHLQNRFFPVHSCTRCIFSFFPLPARTTRWWWNGYTVWFGRLCVILIFYVCYSHLSADVMAEGGCPGVWLGGTAFSFMCGDFFRCHRLWRSVGDEMATLGRAD